MGSQHAAADQKMDSIKKKMMSLANETASAVTRFEKWENEVTTANANAEHLEEQVKTIQKKIQQTESALMLQQRTCLIRRSNWRKWRKKLGMLKVRWGTWQEG